MSTSSVKIEQLEITSEKLDTTVFKDTALFPMG